MTTSTRIDETVAVTTRERSTSRRAAIAVGHALTGPLRVILVLIVIATIFQSLNSNFLTAANISNLALQIVPMGIIASGVVIVLLLGEIDLSVGAMSGLCGSVMAVLAVNQGWPAPLAIAMAIVVGAALGALQGTAITFLGLPSFIVTLAGLLTWQGLHLWVLNDNGTVNITNEAITNLATLRLPNAASWLLAGMGVGGYAVQQLARMRSQNTAGVEADPSRLTVARIVGLAVAAVGVTALLISDRGVPLALVIFIGVLIALNALITASVFGRHLMAVGGGTESARRVGISVKRIIILAFSLTAALGALGGVMAAARLQAATRAAGGSDLLLLAIAAPVIAGVSLFGGRGSVWGALLGSVVIGAISNGMDLMGWEAWIKNTITGLVLFVAVALDALARQRRRRQGLV